MSRRLVLAGMPAFLVLLPTVALLPGCGRQPEPSKPPIVREPPTKAKPDPKALNTSELINLLKLIPEDDFEERVRILEIVVAREPSNQSAQLKLMNAAELQGMCIFEERGREASTPYFTRAARAARDLLEMDAPLTDDQRDFAGITLYNEACCLALDNEPDRAIEALEVALELGFNYPTIHDDPDLDSLRDRDDFRRLLSHVPEPDKAPNIEDPPIPNEPTPGEEEAPTVNGRVGEEPQSNENAPL